MSHVVRALFVPLLSACAAASEATPPPVGPAVVGLIRSTAPMLIDGTVMAPDASPVWPLASGDEVAAISSTAVFTASDGNRLTFQKESKARVLRIEEGRTYVFLRQGTVSFHAAARQVFICAGGHLYVPPPSSKGTIRLDASNTVLRRLDSGQFLEDGVRACGESGILNIVSRAGALGGSAGVAAAGTAGGAAAAAGAGAGTAAGVGGAVAAGGAAAGVSAGAAAGTAAGLGIGTATATAIAGGAVAAASAAAVGLGSSASASGSASGTTASTVASTLPADCAAAGGGCNFNPQPVSPSQPE